MCTHRQSPILFSLEFSYCTSPAKDIYNFLIEEVTHRNLSLIPSINEKKSPNVKWGVVFKNIKLLKGLNADVKCFVWKITQDLLPVGCRIHRRNAERRCLTQIYKHWSILLDHVKG